MEFFNLIASRYSCRSFSSRPVPQAAIDKIIEAGLTAPTAVNRQPFHIFSLDSEAAQEALCQTTSYTFGASRFLLVGSKKEEAWQRKFDGADFSHVDGAIAATHMVLAISDLGLCTTWVGCFDAPLLQKLLPQTADYDLIALFPIGYAAEDALPSPRHSQRKTAEEMTTVL